MADLREHIETVVRYVNYGLRPGAFTEAVLRNDLFDAMANSDFDSHRHVLNLCRFIVNKTPADSYGSPEIVRDWIKKRGLEGMGRPLLPEDDASLLEQYFSLTQG